MNVSVYTYMWEMKAGQKSRPYVSGRKLAGYTYYNMLQIQRISYDEYFLWKNEPDSSSSSLSFSTISLTTEFQSSSSKLSSCNCQNRRSRNSFYYFLHGDRKDYLHFPFLYYTDPYRFDVCVCVYVL